MNLFPTAKDARCTDWIRCLEACSNLLQVCPAYTHLCIATRSHPSGRLHTNFEHCLFLPAMPVEITFKM